LTVVDHDRARPATEPTQHAARISGELARLFRFGARMKNEVVADQAGGRDLPMLVVLHRLAEEGPLRAGALAERVHMDPSQVSRAVAALVREGAVERRADPHDGRATLLVTTDTGRSVAERFARARAAHVSSVVADWDPADADAFASTLERFVDGLERLLQPRDGRPRDTPDGDGAPGTPTTSPTTAPGSTRDARRPGEAVKTPDAAIPGDAQ